MTQTPYYKAHWVHIEEERLARYERFFQWQEGNAWQLEGLDPAPGMVLADYGCGPGHLSLELARRVGPDGHVHALDVNADFVASTRAKAEAAGLADRISVHHLTGEPVPLPDASIDGVMCKTVLVYVDDPAGTLAEFRRILKPGGRAQLIDSDWDLFTVDAVPPDVWRRFMQAAGHAFSTPQIGRRLYALAREAGFAEVVPRIVARPDLDGRLMNVVQNMAGYVCEGGTLPEVEIAAVLAQAETAREEGRFFAVNPQFMVTATA